MATHLTTGTGSPADEPSGATRSSVWLAAVLSALIPGAGQLYLRRFSRAALWFSPVIVLVAAAIAVLDMSLRGLASAAVDPLVLRSIVIGSAITAVWRVAASADAYAVARRNRTTGSPSDFGPGLSTAVAWGFLFVAIVAPHLAVSSYANDAERLIDAVFIEEGQAAPDEPLIPIGTDADIVPDPATMESSPPAVEPHEGTLDDSFLDPDLVEARIHRDGNEVEAAPAPFLPFDERVGTGRFTVLLAGGDGGPGRAGMRTDTMIVASINTATGKASLFGFPRNMGSIPLPRTFEDAFIGYELELAPPPEPVPEGEEPPEIESCHCFPNQMNAIYPFTRKWVRTYPNEVDPGMAALRDILANLMGINIDYYFLVDMAAFVDLVDAIGGIDVNVQVPLVSEVSPPREGDPWAKVDVDVGWNHLDGPQALAYTRARKGSSDYTRMERQRCMLRGVAAKATPLNLLRSFPAIADAMSGSVVSDIPRAFVPDLITAAAKLDLEDIQTVGFTHAYWLDTRDHLYHPIPDVEKIKRKVRSVFDGQDDGVTQDAGSSECEA